MAASICSEPGGTAYLRDSFPLVWFNPLWSEDLPRLCRWAKGHLLLHWTLPFSSLKAIKDTSMLHDLWAGKTPTNWCLPTKKQIKTNKIQPSEPPGGGPGSVLHPDVAPWAL